MLCHGNILINASIMLATSSTGTGAVIRSSPAGQQEHAYPLNYNDHRASPCCSSHSGSSWARALQQQQEGGSAWC